MHLRVMSVSQLGGGGGVSANLNLYGYFSCACHRLLTLVILLLNEPNDVALPSLSNLCFYCLAGLTAPIALTVAHKDLM